MPHIRIFYDDNNQEDFTIYKRLSTIGSSSDADIQIKDAAIEPICAYINHDCHDYTLVIPNDKKAARFADGDKRKNILSDQEEFFIGKNRLLFSVGQPQEKSDSKALGENHAYKRLLEFSQKIALEKDIKNLLATLLKEITQLTGAEHGFLVLVEDGVPRIKVRESITKENEFEHISPMSDSIVKKVIENKKPIIISDALSDQEFSSSLSVINYRLSSVMCAPLIYQGQIFGAVYVGNNSFISAFNDESLELMTIYSSQAAMLVQNALHINALKEKTNKLQESLELTKFGGMIGACQGMQEVFSQVQKVASTDISILIMGETGTGKELIARELHNHSQRKNGPFVIINCGAIPENLLESELFGHVRGAFTGALQTRIGKFQAANNGTLFLDEVGEMPMHLQVKLLRALQEHKVTKVGDTKSESVNIRVIAATNRNLIDMVKNNTFREDLYYRLNVVQITAPPLRERGNDVLVIANFYLQKYAKIYGKEIIGLSEEAQNALLNYHWPGNVRQLENRIKRAIVMCDHNRIGIDDLDVKSEADMNILPLSDALDRFRHKYINASLERNAGNRTKTATELGVDPRTIFRHLHHSKREEER